MNPNKETKAAIRENDLMAEVARLRAALKSIGSLPICYYCQSVEMAQRAIKACARKNLGK